MNNSKKYKNSNYEWIGNIPTNWSLSKVRNFFKERNEKVDDKKYPPLSVTMLGIVDQLTDVAKSDDSENRKLVKKNDFVINSRSDRKGSSGIATRDGSVSLINTVLQPQNIFPKYAEYLFKSYYFKEEYFKNGKGIHWDLWTTKWDQFRNIYIPVPSEHEQKLICKFLDNQIMKLNQLIKKIKAKIIFLEENRVSLIHRLTTRGIDTSVEMKKSASEFIEEIPIHWEIWSIKHLVNSGEIEMQDGNHGEMHPKSEDYVDQGIPFIMASDLKDRKLDIVNCKKLKKVRRIL